MFSNREVRAAVAGVVAVAAYLLAVLSTGLVPIGEFANLLAFYLDGSFVLWMFIGLIAVLVVLYQGRPRKGESVSPTRVLIASVKGRWQRDRFVSMFWPPLLFALLMASFNAFKQLVLPIAGFPFDPAFAAADRLLFLGADPWTVSHALFGSPAATLLIDRAYHGWFAPMSVGVLLCAWLPASSYSLRNQYLLTYIAVWVVIGSVAAFLMPSAGPCYYEHFVGSSPSFAELHSRLLTLQTASGSELAALRNQAMLLEHFGADELAVGGGISAMPSVHNGLAVLFAIAAFRIKRWFGVLLAAYATLIWIGSFHLGWHYALDGIVAGAMTYGLWLLAGTAVRRLDRTPQPSTAAAVPA